MSATFKSHKTEVLQALKSAIDRGLDAIGDSCVGHAQDHTPVKSSIIHEREGEATEVIGPSDSAAPYKPVDYAKYVELGTYKTNPQPFLRPAAENYQSEYVAIMRDELGL